MSVMDKLINAMKFNDDPYDEENETEDSPYYDEEPEKEDPVFDKEDACGHDRLLGSSERALHLQSTMQAIDTRAQPPASRSPFLDA